MNAPDLSDYIPATDLAQAATMPARWYTDADFLSLEAQKIFYRTWQPVGRLDNVARLAIERL